MNFYPDVASTIATAVTLRGLLRIVKAREVSSEELWEYTHRPIPVDTSWAILLYWPNRTLTIRHPLDVEEWHTQWGREEEWPAVTLFLATDQTMQTLYTQMAEKPYTTEDIRRRMAFHLEGTRVAVFTDFTWQYLIRLMERQKLMYQPDD